jgi:hypothetical protein
MASNIKSDRKDKPTKSSAARVKRLGKVTSKNSEVLNDTSAGRKRAVIDPALDKESLIPDLDYAPDEYLGNDLYSLRYDINENGIGKILLPPSLSSLLQSDRICISPSSGGLFIKSL